MSKNMYIRGDNRFFSGFSSGNLKFELFRKALILLLAIVVLGGAIYAGIVFSSKISLDNTYNGFVSACDKKDYKKAILLYHNIQEKTLSSSIFVYNRNEQKSMLLKMEDQVGKLVETPFIALVNNQTDFSAEEVVLMREFKELALRKISVLANDYMEEFLLGKHPRESVVKTLAELKKIDTFKEMAIRYEGDIDSITGFSAEMIAIDTEFKEKKYIAAATKLKAAMDSRGGFLKEYLERYYLRCKTEMYPAAINDIDVMMTGSKYYSAMSVLEQLIVIFKDDPALKSKLDACKEKVTKKLVEFNGPVEHLAIRPLIATPKLAFDHDNYAKNAEDLMITTNEFRKILEQLYNNQYILVDINSLVDSTGQKTRLFYPEGKKPLIMTIEGLNYYAGRSRSGNSENLYLDSDGNVVSSYKNENGVEIKDRNGEAIGILEQFIESHPDFSFDGAKGCISLTGFECVFGYVTNQDQVDDRKEAFIDNQLSPFSITEDDIKTNRQNVMDIINKLKNKGWSFASSSYGSIMVAESSLEQLQIDTQKWLEQVGSLTGTVKVFLFPSGSIVGSKDAKGEYLIKNGFLIHAGIGPWAYFNASSGINLYMDRISLNGLSMRYQNLSRFFDVKTIYDPLRTIPLKA